MPLIPTLNKETEASRNGLSGSRWHPCLSPSAVLQLKQGASRDSVHSWGNVWTLTPSVACTPRSVIERG